MDGIFEQWFRGWSWGNWRTALKATSALPLAGEEVEFFKSISGGREPPRKRPREVWYIIGRRGGKDSIVSLVAAHAAATFDPRGILRPGERAVVACIAPDRETAKIVKNYIIAFFEMVPSLKKMIQRVTDDVVELSNMVDIAIMTGDSRSVRGRPILCAILDEAAHLRGGESNNESDIELYAALTPGMAMIPQAQLFGISTPYAKRGLLYKKWIDGFGKDSDDVLVIQAPSHVMNPKLDTRDRDRMMAEDPSRARAEWYGEFRDDIVAFIDPEAVGRCVMNGRVELPYVKGTTYVAAIDPSGGSSDAMTLAIAHASGDVGVLDLLKEWPAPFSPQEVVLDFVKICRQYGIANVIGDRYAGEWAREPFRNQGIQYQLSDHTRSEAYLTLLPAINSGKIELLDDARTISQLCALERRTARSGKDSVDHPRGGHDDLINAAALALVNAALAPATSAENWLEYMRRETQRAADFDAVRPAGPNFGFSFGSSPDEIVRLTVPGDVSHVLTPDGISHLVRSDSDGRYVNIRTSLAREMICSGMPSNLADVNTSLAAKLISTSR
jgi:hypothetical protein